MVYYFKDIRDVFSEENSEYQIASLKNNTAVELEFQLDFSGADLSNITEESYVAWMDLLRTANKDYPMGNGNKLDDYSEEVKAKAVQQLGFAVRAQNLEQLAVNTYPEAKETNSIDYNVMLDFSEILKQASGVGLEALLEKYAGYKYKVTYQIYEKSPNETSVVYKKYSGNDIVLTASNDTQNITGAGGTMEVTYSFTKEQLQKKREENGGFFTFPCAVTIHTKNLTKDATKLTNYKVEATLVITESETETQPALETKDFFIYTITKLKTDL